MRDWMRAAGVWLYLGPAALGCGVRPVELAPTAAAAPAAVGDIVVGEVAASAIARLRAAPDEAEPGQLALIYPDAPSLIIPANLAPIPFEWSAGKPGPMREMPPKPKDPAPPKMPPAPPEMPPAPPEMPPGPADPVAYELRLRGERSTLRLYTATSRAVFPIDRWRGLLRDHAEHSLQVELRALRTDGTIVGADPIELAIWSAPPAGVLYTWSTTAQGLGRNSLESTHDSHITPPSPLAPAGCVGCHSVSRDGRRLLAAVGGRPSLASWPVTGGSALELPISAADPQSYVFGSFDPTAARIAVSAAGRLLILDADNGQVLQDSAWPMAATFEYPSWSRDGRSIAVVLTPPPKMPMEAGKGGVLARIRVALDGSLSDPEPIVSAMPDESLRSPSYSPDDAWIAFERRKGPAQNARDGSIWLVAAAGGDPLELIQATDDRKPLLGASSPAFIPGDLPDRAFLVFASQRPVGSFAPADGQYQLFAAALDLTLAAAGSDPSRAAFWLPFQQLTSSYLRAQWAPAVSSWGRVPEVCDGADDDGDQRVDEDCCTPQPDTCGDSEDNDCDGSIDEGCGCAFSELCGNASDDDCDLRIDEQPCRPAPMQK